MITISVLGLDQYIVGHYSKEHTANLASLFETTDDNISFYAPNAMVFHNGVEQTSWNTIVIVKAPHQFKPFENKVASYLLSTISPDDNPFSINCSVEFEYYDEGTRYEKYNETYPRFITFENVVEPDYGEEDDDCDCDPRDHAELDYNDENQIYLGDTFEGLDEKIEAIKKAKNK